MNLNAIISLFWDVVFFGSPLVTIAWVIIENRKLPKGQVSEEKFSILAKIGVVALCAFFPIISGAIFYYALRKKFPKKAGFANLASWVVFALELAFFLYLFGSFQIAFFKNYPK